MVKRRVTRRTRDAVDAKKAAAASMFDVATSVPAESLGEYILWLYGESGIGKTSLAARFGRTFHFMFGDRDSSLRIKKKQITGWDEFETATETWADRDEYDTAVIDVVDEAYEMCFEFMGKEGRLQDPWGNDVEHPNDANDMGKSWKKVKRRFMSPLHRLVRSGKGLIFISHGKFSERKTAEGDEVEDVHPAISGQGLEAIFGLSDIIGYYHTRGKERVLQIQPSAGIVAKCRPEENFRYSDGSQILRIPMGSSPDKGFSNITAAFENRLQAPEVKQLKRRVGAKARRQSKEK